MENNLRLKTTKRVLVQTDTSNPTAGVKTVRQAQVHENIRWY